MVLRAYTGSDMNKILRAPYGSWVEYQNLAIDAISHFRKWDEELKNKQVLPPGFTESDMIFRKNGSLTMNDTESLTQFEIDSMNNMAAAGLQRTQIVLTNLNDLKRAEDDGFGFAVNPFNRKLESNFGLLDTSGGMLYADLACRFALHRAEKLGVKLVLGGNKGTFSRLLRRGSNQVVGVQTEDGISHLAALTIMACGGWTPTLIPELDGLCETTAGSVSIFQLPSGNKRLWDHFSPDNFPTWT